MDILKIFRMQEPVSKELLSKNNEIGKYKEAMQEKDVLLKNNRARIKELEEQIAELENTNSQLENQLTAASTGYEEYENVMDDYNEFIEEKLIERRNMLEENQALHAHVDALEHTCEKLNAKLNLAKRSIEELQRNEDILKTNLEEYAQTINKINANYNTLKDYSNTKLGEANTEIDNKVKENIKEVAVLKAKILQSQAEINELQKHVHIGKLYSKTSMFEPLKSNLTA